MTKCARRKLAEVGLLCDVKFQAVRTSPGDPVQADRVVSQMPQAGTPIQPSGTVTIFIGRPS